MKKSIKCLLVILILVLMSFSVCAQEVTLSAEELLEKSLAVDNSNLKSTDGQPLIGWEPQKDVPARPEDPKKLPETNPLRWWDEEYAGYNVVKEVIPEPPKDGAWGKKVVLLQAGHHPYWAAYLRGFEKIAKSYNMDYKIYNGNWDLNLQAQQTTQAINDDPDIIVFAPADVAGSLPLLRKIYMAGIPVIASNTIPSDEAMKYCISWVGPDDWGQMRKLARAFADEMGKEGGYAIVRHIPGTSCFNGRTYSIITELLDYAPKMKMLDMDVSNLKSEPTLNMVSTWLTKYGDSLKGIMVADDGEAMSGCLESLRNAGRKDITVIAAGHSKNGLDAIKNGEVFAITYQSAESDGAMGIQMAADWLNGKTLPPVRALAQKIITKENVEEYYPPQW